MTYENIYPALFLDRPNRFIAHVLFNGEETVCHVKNTGRCRELLLPGARVYIQESGNAARSTKYDLIAVEKGRRLINMDSGAPNRVFGEFLAGGGLVPSPTLIRPEAVFGSSRFDFYVEAQKCRMYCEVKGVTLEQDGVVRFPDAPTARGVKHLRGLAEARRAGFEACAAFIIQMENVRYLEPNRATDPAFARALEEASAAGVRLLALDCAVTPESLTVRSPVEIRL